MSGVHHHQHRAAGTGSLHIDVAGRTEVTDPSVSFLAYVRCYGWALLVEKRQSRWEELLLSCCGSCVGPDFVQAVLANQTNFAQTSTFVINRLVGCK